MNLSEYQAKQLFSAYSIPIPKGTLVSNSNEVTAATGHLEPPYMIKAQVPMSGRGKAGGIIPAQTTKDTQQATAKLLGTHLKGLTVKQVLIEEKIATRKELYLSVNVDRNERTYVILTSATGGIEIEETVNTTPNTIAKTPIDFQIGLNNIHANTIAKNLGYSGKQLSELSEIIQKLYQICLENDAELVETNPLAETNNGSFVALDARIVIDDNSLFRHPKYAELQVQTLSRQETLALKSNLSYTKLEGNIGVVGNGAGLVMATLDLINSFGGKPADFLDLGGGATIESITAALEIVFDNNDAKVILVNVLGGITHCDDVARGIVKVASNVAIKKPLVVRLIGTNQHEGQRILTEAGINALDSMEEAAKQAVGFAKGAKV